MTCEEDKKKNANNDRKDDDVLFGGVFVTLKILFVDLLVVCLRLSSEVTQGYQLLSDGDTWIYGIVTFIIIEIPGIAAAVHVLSVYRENWVWYKTILYAIGAIIFYPLVPIMTLLHLLWMTPSDGQMTKESKQRFMAAQFGATVAQAIHGCIASPLMLCYQIWLVFNGVISFADSAVRVTSITLTDWEGNQLMVTFAAPVTILLSIVT